MKRILCGILLALLFSTSLSARTKLQGIVEKGGQNIVTQGAQSSTKSVRTFPNSTVTVYLTGTLTLATLYSDASGTSKPNPFTAGSDASFGFFADDGTYDIKFSPVGFSAWTLSNVTIGGSGSINTFTPVMTCNGVGGATAVANATALNSSLAAAGALGGQVIVPTGICMVASGLTISGAKPITLTGTQNNFTGATGAVLRASSAMTALLTISSSVHTISAVQFDANRLASYGIQLSGTVGTVFDKVGVVNALLDGWHSIDALNQANQLKDCYTSNSGTLFATSGIISQYINGTVAPISGTATTVSGSATITIADGPANLATTTGARIGDFVRVGSVSATAYYSQIKAISTNTITVEDLGVPTSSVSGQEYAIGVGSGWYEELSSTNGFNTIQGSWFRNSGAAGFMMSSLYADHLLNGLCDFNNFVGVSLGTAFNVGTMYQPVVDHTYMEGNFLDYFIGNVTDASIRAPTTVVSDLFYKNPVNTSTGMICRGNYCESLQFGKPQNFLFIITRSGGVIKHQIVSDLRELFSSLAADQVNGASSTLATTPIGATALDSTHGFVSGAGILSGTTNFIVLDTPGGYLNAGQFYGSAVIENQKISSGTQSTVPLRVQPDMLVSTNVNGVTRNRLMFIVSNGFTNAAADLTASTNGLPVDGDFIAIRFNGYIK